MKFSCALFNRPSCTFTVGFLLTLDLWWINSFSYIFTHCLFVTCTAVVASRHRCSFSVKFTALKFYN